MEVLAFCAGTEEECVGCYQVESARTRENCYSQTREEVLVMVIEGRVLSVDWE